MNFQKWIINKWLRIIAINFICTTLLPFANGQSYKLDSASIYDYWSKRAIIEVLHAYMNDYIMTVTDSALPIERRLDCSKERRGIAEYEKRYLTDYSRWEKTDLSGLNSELSQFLKKNNWSSAERNLLQPLFKKVQVGSPLNREFFEIVKAKSAGKGTDIPGHNNKLTFWNKTIDSILNGYKEAEESRITTGGDHVYKPTDPDKPTSPTPVNAGNTSKSKGIHWNYYIIIVLLIIFITGTVSFIFAKAKYHYQSSERIRSLEKELSDLNEKFALLQHIHRETKPTPAVSATSHVQLQHEDNFTPDTSTKIGQNVPPKQSSIPGKNHIYFSIPEMDGRFLFSRGEQTNDGTKHYKVEYTSTSAEGELSYISGKQDKRAINRLDSYLKPACDIENLDYAENATNIQMLKQGKVTRSADCWIVDNNNKVKVKLV